MKLNLRLTTPPAKIKEMIADQTTEYLNKKIRKNYARVVNSLRQKIPFWIRSQPEIQSLLGEGIPGSLNALFGLYNGDASRAVNDIIEAIKQSTSIKIEKINRRYQGNIEFAFQSSDFINILGLSSGHVATEKGADLHWLEWLVSLGDTIIVTGYQYSPKASGRSGGGIMKKGAFFRVPPQYAGTLEDNFITRALSNREKEIDPIMARLFE
jgi:hypothetical protein